MTTIHHATQAKAEKLGVILTLVKSNEDGTEQVSAFWPKRSKKVMATTGKAALALMALQQRFGDEYANLEVRNNGMASVVAKHGGEETELFTFDAEDFEEDAIFADALEQMVEQGIEAEEVEDEKVSGNVVPVKYRQRYAEQGHANTCGDWLANILIDECTAIDEKGKPFFDVARFDAIYDSNKGLRTHKWCKNTSGNGWQGRYRMSGRIALAKIVGTNGYLVLDNQKLTPPAEWLERFAPKEKPAKASAEKKAA